MNLNTELWSIRQQYNTAFRPRKRIFNHRLDAVLPEDDNSLDRSAVVADGVEDVL